MKTFMYFEGQEGGMTAHTIDGALGAEHFSRSLYGWMTPDCADIDAALCAWFDGAEIGDRFKHRLGWAVRVKDGK